MYLYFSGTLKSVIADAVSQWRDVEMWIFFWGKAARREAAFYMRWTNNSASPHNARDQPRLSPVRSFPELGYTRDLLSSP